MCERVNAESNDCLIHGSAVYSARVCLLQASEGCRSAPVSRGLVLMPFLFVVGVVALGFFCANICKIGTSSMRARARCHSAGVGGDRWSCLPLHVFVTLIE